MKKLTTARDKQCKAMGIKRGWERATERGNVERSALYTTTAWRKARLHYLSRYPLCKACEAVGRLVTATVVDHIKPHRGDLDLFWDEGNWQGLCKPCHDRKTAREIAERRRARS